MSDWYYSFVLLMNNYFNIPVNAVIPAIISAIVIATILFLVMYEVFKKISETAAAGVSLIVSIALGIYYLYSGWWAFFGGLTAIMSGVILFLFILMGLWFIHGKELGFRVSHMEKGKEKWMKKREIREAKRLKKKGESEQYQKEVENYLESLCNDFKVIIKDFDQTPTVDLDAVVNRILPSVKDWERVFPFGSSQRKIMKKIRIAMEKSSKVLKEGGDEQKIRKILYQDFRYSWKLACKEAREIQNQNPSQNPQNPPSGNNPPNRRSGDADCLEKKIKNDIERFKTSINNAKTWKAIYNAIRLYSADVRHSPSYFVECGYIKKVNPGSRRSHDLVKFFFEGINLKISKKEGMNKWKERVTNELNSLESEIHNFVENL